MKNVMKKMGCLFLISALLVLSACSSGQEASKRSKDGKINVVTTIAQIGEPLSVIGGDRLNVKSLMGPSVDPHLYKATQSDMETLEEADIIFYNGLHLEANMVEIFEKISESKPVLAVGETIPEESLLKDEKGVVDPHIWFDLDLWQQALDAAVEQLKEFSPEDADYFEENKKKYFARLADLKKKPKSLRTFQKVKEFLSQRMMLSDISDECTALK